MSRRPASVTQAEIARAIRAAKKAGAEAVEVVMPSGGKIVVLLKSVPLAPAAPSSGNEWDDVISAALRPQLP